MRNDRTSTLPIEADGPADDYLVEGDTAAAGPSAALRIVHGLQIVLIVIMAALSFAIFWLVGLMFNIL